MTDTGDNTLTVRDNRTGKDYEIPISDGTIKAGDLSQIKIDDDSPVSRPTTPGSPTPRRARAR